MFTLLDGRECFYQWDSDVQIVVSDPTVSEVHFCNRTDDCSLVVEVKDKLVNVPNILLQSDFPIRVYAFCDTYTKIERIFKVCKRSRPADYLYTETEVLNYDSLCKRMDKIEAAQGVDLDDYYTKTDVDNKLEDLEVDVDLTGYATEKWVEDKKYLTDLPDHEHKQYLTELPSHTHDQYLTEHQDLTDYATKKYVDDQIADIDIPTGGSGEQEAFCLDFRNATTSAQPCTEDMIKFMERYIESNGNVSLHVKAGTTDISFPAIVQTLPSGAFIIEPYTLMQHNINSGTELPYYVFILSNASGEWKYNYSETGSFSVATKEYVDSVAGGGGSSEGGAKIYYLDFSAAEWMLKDSTDEMKEFYNEYINSNGEILLYIKTPMENNCWVPGEVSIQGSSIYITPNVITNDVIQDLFNGWNKSYNVFQLTSTEYKIYSGYEITASGGGGSKDWHWVEVNSNGFSMNMNLEHIKLIVDYNGEYITYDISSYEYLNTINRTYTLPHFSTSMSITFYDWDNATINTGTIVGYYYWG